jgi:hypothetical protein
MNPSKAFGFLDEKFPLRAVLAENVADAESRLQEVLVELEVLSIAQSRLDLRDRLLDEQRLSSDGERVVPRVENGSVAREDLVPPVSPVGSLPGVGNVAASMVVLPGAPSRVLVRGQKACLFVKSVHCVECGFLKSKCLCKKMNCSVCLKIYGQCRCCSVCGRMSDSRCSQCHDFMCRVCIVKQSMVFCCRVYAQKLKPVSRALIGAPLHPLNSDTHCLRCARISDNCVCCEVCLSEGVMKCSACRSVYCSDSCEMVHGDKCTYRNMLKLKIRGRSVKFDDGAVAQVGCAQGGVSSLPANINTASREVGGMASRFGALADRLDAADGILGKLSSVAIPLTNVLESMNSVLTHVRSAILSVVSTAGVVVEWVGNNLALLGIALCSMTPIARWGLETVTTVLTLLSRTIEFAGDTVVAPGLSLFLRLVKSVNLLSPQTEEEGAVAQVGFSGNCVMGAVLLLTLVKSPESHVLKAIRYVAPLAVGLSAMTVGFESALKWLPENGQKWLVECGFLRPLGELSRDYGQIVSQFMGMFDRASVVPITELEIPFKMAFCDARDKVVGAYHAETCGKSSGCAMMIGKMIIDSDCFYRSFKAHIRDIPKVQAMSSMLYGPAGSGKSSLAMTLSVLLCPSTSSYNVAWTRTVGDKYWSGYAGEEAVIYDDISQGSNEVKTEICAELIRLIGPVPFRPVMADVDHKGILAEPSCVIASTNDGPSRIINGVNMRAFRRRFLHWWVEPAAAYMKDDGTLDEEKVAAMDQRKRIGYEHMRIWRVTFDKASKPFVHKERLYTVGQVAACMKARALILNQIETLKVSDLKELRRVMLEDEIRAQMVPLEPGEEAFVRDQWGSLRAAYEADPDSFWNPVDEKSEEKDEVVAQVCADCLATGVPGGCDDPGCLVSDFEAVSQGAKFHDDDGSSSSSSECKDDVKTDCDPALDYGVSVLLERTRSPFLEAFFTQVFEMSARSLSLIFRVQPTTVWSLVWNTTMYFVALTANQRGLCCPSCLVEMSGYGSSGMCDACAQRGGLRASTWYVRLYQREYVDTYRERVQMIKQVYHFASPLLRYIDLCNSLGLDVNMTDRSISAGYKYLSRQYHPDHGGEADMMVKWNRIFDELRECRASIVGMVRNSAFFPFLTSCFQRYYEYPSDLNVNLWHLISLRGYTALIGVGAIRQCDRCDGFCSVQIKCYACSQTEEYVQEGANHSVKRLVTLFVDALPMSVGSTIQVLRCGKMHRHEWLRGTISGLVSIVNAARGGVNLMLDVDFVRLARESPRQMVGYLLAGLPSWCVARGVEMGPMNMHVIDALYQSPSAEDKVLDELQFIVPEDDLAAQCRKYSERRRAGWCLRATYETFIDRARQCIQSPFVVDMAKVLAVIGVLVVAYKSAKFIVSCFSNFDEAQVGSNGEDIVFRRHEQEKMVRDKQLSRYRHKREAVRAVANVGPSESVTATTVVLDRISNNMAVVERSVVGSQPYRLCGLFVHKKVLMLPRHFFLNPDQTHILEGSPIIIRCGSITYTVPFSELALTSGPMKDERYLDVCFFDCGCDSIMRTKVTDFPSLVDKFADGIVTDELAGFGGFLLMKSNLQNEVEWVVLPKVTYEASPLEYGLTTKGPKPFYVPTQYVYAPQERGDCGAVLIGVSKNLGGSVTILGAHNADRSRRGVKAGIAMPLSREMLMTEQPDIVQGQMWIEQIDGAYKGGLCDSFKVLARAVNPRMGPQSDKTGYVLSPIHEDPLLATVRRAPAILGSPDDPRSTMMPIELVEKELNRACVGEFGEFPYNPQDVAIVRESLLDSICAFQDDEVPCRRLSVHEALNGGVGSDLYFLKPMCVTTSAGWPWCVMEGIVGKRPLISGCAGEYVVADVRLKRRLIEVWNDALIGRLFSPIVPSKKDELRSPEKIELQETRLVYCMQTEHTITSRMVFGAYVNYIHSIHTISTSAVGMDVLSGDWDEMVKRWRRVGQNGFDGDIKRFDRHLCRQLADMCCDVVDGWYKRFGGYSEDDSRVRRGLVNCMVEGILIVDNRFVLQPSALTSGVFGTTAIFGNLMTQFFMRLSWLHLSRRECPRMIGMNCFDRNVSGSVYGDDNVWVVSDSVGVWYNSGAVADVLAKVGVVYTPAEKGAAHGPNRDFLTLQFLKMRTVRDGRFPGRIYLAIPDKFDLLPSLKWITRSLPGSIALVVNMNAVLRRCFGWARDVWTDFRVELTRSLARVDIHEMLLTWDALLNCDDIIREIGADDFMFEFSAPMRFEERVNLVDTVSFMSRVVPLNRIRRDGVVAQMDVSAPDEVQNLAAGAIRHIIGLGGSTEFGDESVVTEATPISFLTRKMYAFSESVNTGPITRLNSQYLWAINPSDSTAKSGPLAFWGYPFSWYQGSLDVMLTVPGMVEVSWESFAEQHTTLAGPKPYVDFGRTTSTGLLNCGFTNQVLVPAGPSVFMQFNLPSFSRTNFQVYPRFHGDFDDPDAGIGRFSLYNVGNSSTVTGCIMWVGGGSDMRFFQPCLLPMIRYHALGWSKDEAVAQMDGIKSDAVDSDVVHDAQHGEVLRSVGERQQSFTTMAADWQYIETINWSASSPAGDILYSGKFPTFGIAGFNKWAFEAFQYFRGDMHVRLQIDSPIYQLGRIVMGFIPGTREGDLALYLANTVNWTWISHAVLYAGGSREVVLVIPWSFPANYYDLVQDGQMTGTFFIMVGDYIRIGTSGPDTCVMNLSVSFQNTEFLIRRVVPPASRGKAKRIVCKPKKCEDEKDDFVVAQGGSVSRHSTPADSIKVHNFAIHNNSLMRKSPVDNKLGISRHEGSSLEGPGPTIGTFVRRPTFILSQDWTVDDVAGSVLVTLPLTIAPVSLSVDTLLSDVLLGVTSMEYASLPFDQWRCKSLGYRIELVTTRFHSGRLAIASKYGSDFTDPATINDAMSQYAQIIDVADLNNVHDIIVPFASPFNWLYCPKRQMADDIFKAQYALGNLYFIVLNELRAVEAVSPSIVINVYLFAEGVEFRGQTMTMQQRTVELSTFSARKESAVRRNRP